MQYTQMHEETGRRRSRFYVTLGKADERDIIPVDISEQVKLIWLSRVLVVEPQSSFSEDIACLSDNASFQHLSCRLRRHGPA